MTPSLQISWEQLLFLILGSSLLVSGLIGLIRQWRQSLFLSFSLMTIGTYLITSIIWVASVNEVTMLTLWPAFYLHTIQRHQSTRLQPWMSLHLIIPIAWTLVRWITGVDVQQWFYAIAFLQFVPYVALSLVELYQQYRSSAVKKALPPAYLIWSFWGILIVLSIRLLLPFFPGEFSVLLQGFYGITGVYLIGIFSFSIHGPFRYEHWTLELQKEAGTNFEEELKRRLDVLLQQEKVFVIPDLTLQELSHRMQVRSAMLSGFLSTSLGRNFNDVLNEHRVQEVQRLIRDPSTDSKATLMELAYQSGFNSKATFNRIFKELTGMTPKAYKMKVQTK